MTNFICYSSLSLIFALICPRMFCFALVLAFCATVVVTDSQIQSKTTCAAPHKSDDKTFTVYDANDRPFKGERVPIGGYVHLECAAGYFFSDGSNSSESVCRPTSRAEWHPAIKPCQLNRLLRECGLPSQDPMTTDGLNATLGQFPWNVAIYSKRRSDSLICSGTLIAPNVVISAAHCFYNESYGTPATTPADYALVVGKLTRNNTAIDGNAQKTIPISEILFHDKKPYHASVSGYASDIALIILKERITFSPHVLPACLWTNLRVEFDLAAGAVGTVCGWGLDETGRPAATLKTMKLQFVPYHQCSGKILGGVTWDKFCAEADRGPRPQRGDGGAGLMFKDSRTNFYFLRGIVSTIQRSSETHPLTSFTDISYYQDWIVKVIQEKSGDAAGESKNQNQSGSTRAPTSNIRTSS